MSSTTAKIGALFAVVAACAMQMVAQPQAAAADALWLCHPALATDPCNTPLDTTDMATRVVNTPAPTDRPIDCLYIYPTADNSIALNQPYAVTPSVETMAMAQVARFSSLCRVFSPVYRQVTTPALGTVWSPFGAIVIEPGYRDVEAAWNQYLANDNQGRGVIIIGHSQGTMLARKLIHDHIDPDPSQRARLVGAFLMGGNVTTAKGRVTGGDFANTPLCTERGQSGCVVAYSVAASDPLLSVVGSATGPLAMLLGTSLGLPFGDGYEVACTDPGMLSGDYAPQGLTIPTTLPGNDTVSIYMRTILFPDSLPTAPTAWATTTVRATGRCTDRNGYRFYTIDAPQGGHLNELPGNQLHGLDLNLGADRLVSIASQQAETWLASR
jgi:pimeloyl-ACP methyl ester carboxylesterase